MGSVHCCVLPRDNFFSVLLFRLPLELTLLQKYEVASAEGEQAKMQIDECKNVSEKLIDDLRVSDFKLLSSLHIDLKVAGSESLHGPVV